MADRDPILDLPRIGTRFKFVGGDIVKQVSGVCEIIAAEPRPNAAGRMGGRVWYITEHGHESTVPLSFYREYAREIVKPPDVEGVDDGK